MHSIVRSFQMDYLDSVQTTRGIGRYDRRATETRALAAWRLD
jgi:hypothetical protein